MAIDTSKGHHAMDYAEHNRTYAGFLKLTKYSIIALVVVAGRHEVFLGLRRLPAISRLIDLKPGQTAIDVGLPFLHPAIALITRASRPSSFNGSVHGHDCSHPGSGR